MGKSLKETFQEANDILESNRESVKDEICSRLYKIKANNAGLGMRHTTHCDCIFEVSLDLKDQDEPLSLNMHLELTPTLICKQCREYRFRDHRMSISDFIAKIEEGDIEVAPSETLKKLAEGSIVPMQKWYIKHETSIALYLGLAFGLLLGVVLMWLAFALANWLF